MQGFSGIEEAEEYRRKNEFIKDLLLALSRGAPGLAEKEIFEKALEIAVVITDSRVGYLHLVNDDQTTISLIAWNQEALKFCTAAHDSHYPLDQAGIWADCARYKKAVIHNDYPNHPDRKGVPEGHFPIQRHMSVPVLDGNLVRMILGVGNKEKQYDDGDVRQLQFVADEVLNFAMRKRAEGKLALMNSELELRVKEEVHRRIENEQLLIQQSKMASMGEMMGAIAHQWKQPLNQLSLLVDDLKEAYELGEIDEDYVSKCVVDAKNSISFMNQTIVDFRNFFKPAKQLEKFFPCEASMEVHRLVAARFHENNIRFITEEHECFTSMGYPNEFKQVLLNIFTNSRDAIEEKGINNGYIHVVFEKDQNSGRIIIMDNGGGINPDYLPDRLFQIHETTKGDRGTGIGLHICKIIVETHMKGKIEAFNTEDGSEFIITLPLCGDA